MKKNVKFSKWILIITSIAFALPSIIYLLRERTTFNFNGDLEYCFLLTNNIDRVYQTIVYMIILAIFFYCYFIIAKNRNYIFKDIKQIFKYIVIISAVFIFVIPFWCSDVFYYLGIGRLTSTYHQNPYYTDIKSYIDDNNINLENDSLMQKGYNNYWSNTTVVYGAFWTLICSIISFLSFGNLDFGLLIFKILNLIVHIGNCYLLYKISNRKIFPLLYGLNPFVLIEGISNVHNDIFLVFFTLLSLYFVLKKKNIIASIISLALATDIKYVSVLLLPFIVIYHFKDKDIKTKIIKCIEYGILFILFAGLPYIIYIKNMDVFLGLSEQRNRIAKGFYLFISEYFNKPENLVDNLKNIALLSFAIIYIYECFRLLFSPNIKFYRNMRIMYNYLIVFLFFLITNFQPWYFMWLAIVMVWQKANNIKLTIQIQLLTLIANIVFLVYSENYKYGVPFFTIFVMGILICIIKNKNDYIKRHILRRNYD